MSIVETIDNRVCTVKFDSGEELYEALCSPKGKYRGLVKNCIFRGEASGKWTLLPSAFRKNLIDKWKASLPYYFRKGKVSNQVFTEISVTGYFYVLANRRGLQLPAMPDNWKKTFLTNDTSNIKIEDLRKWPNEGLYEFLALAQHYGIPTRFLDWSFNYKVALYFMSVGACRHLYENEDQYQDDSMVLWALRSFHYKEKMNIISLGSFNIIVPEYSYNPNICAQQGVLTYWDEKKSWTDNVNPKPLEELINNQDFDETQHNLHRFLIEDIPLLYKFVCPIKYCHAILWQLGKDGIDASTIFPGHKGVADAVYETWFYSSTIF